jgi:hypothetical protein
MYAPEETFAEACGTIRKCIEQGLVTPESRDNHDHTMREWCQGLPDLITGFLE